MKKELVQKILHFVITILTAIVTTLGTTSCIKADVEKRKEGLFPLQFASLEKEPFLGHILREAEVSHLARGAYLSVMAQRSLDKGKIPLHFLDASPDFESDIFSGRNGVAIAHGKVCGLTGGL